MMFPKKEIVERIRKEYPKGTRVRLIKMDDMQAPPLGTEGTVIGVDDTTNVSKYSKKYTLILPK